MGRILPPFPGIQVQAVTDQGGHRLRAGQHLGNGQDRQDIARKIHRAKKHHASLSCPKKEG